METTICRNNHQWKLLFIEKQLMEITIYRNYHLWKLLFIKTIIDVYYHQC